MKNGYVIIFLLLASIFLYSCGGTEQEHVHDYSATRVIEPTCEAKGYTEHKCECGDVIKDDYWAALGHDIVKDEKVNPTCLRNGLGEGEHCTRCDYKVEQVVIDRLEHDYDPNTNICNQCKVNKYSINLSFEFDEGAQGYVVQSIGSEINCIITIPATYKSYPVIGIKEGALRYNDQIIEVYIPESVNYIGDLAFKKCSNLENINVDENNQNYMSIDGNLYTKDGKTLLAYAIGKKENGLIIPEGVTTIAKYAFNECENIVYVTFPESLIDIEDYAFMMCMNLSDIELSDNIVSIGKRAFLNCDSIKNIKFPKELKSIADEAFCGCENLITIDLPSKLETVGTLAFGGCDNVTTITIGDSLSSIGLKAFDCYNLTSINVSEKNQYFKSIDGNLYTKDEKTLLKYAIGKEESSFTVPNHVTTIGEYAFDESRLESIELSDSVITVGPSAFHTSNDLKDIKFSENLKIIESYGFYGCSDLVTITLPNSLETIEDHAFAGCFHLKNINIGDNTKNISISAFFSDFLSDINVSKNNKYFSSIDGDLYSKDGTALLFYAWGKDSKTFVVPSFVTTIKTGAINVDEKLKTIVIPESVTTIEARAIIILHHYTNVYCKASKKPSGFEKNWIDYVNRNNVNLVWGYTEE